MNMDSHLQEDLSTNNENLYTNELGIPPPRQENITELSRYFIDLRGAVNEKSYLFQRHELEQGLERITLRTREMNFEKDYLYSNLRTLEQIKLVERRLNHYKCLEESNNDQPPQWFINFFNDPNVGFLALKREMVSMDARQNQRLEALENRQNQRLEALETRQNQRLEALETRQNRRSDVIEESLRSINQKLSKQEYRYYRLHNIQLRSLGKSIDVVPFVNGQEPDFDLPQIHSIEDIENLTKDQCTRYLDGYGIQYGPNETIKLKERLRNAVGLESLGDSEFLLSGFR
ncbi:meiotic expression up-regulated protein [Schizosaccharomyces octosporus yFS286]|uniref:Meiotic expression up-regulated protein n=1 Tax=Schizosaccharomyces octosporus (strain yFS286) TaxID=483514 RepID=S9PW15_SCHOY|nr:meiotic expression up-regulated protein [Schizosaccharomyces octosporus yFS286]EPX71658.1 meiotic expression up-regulated protein [Schizosaccharomyces octosporus yFS286]